jgi:hypothetical protein
MSTDIGFYEIFVDQKITCKQAYNAISRTTNISLTEIGIGCDFMALLPENPHLLLGIDLYYYDGGYHTFINLLSFVKFSEYNFYSICSKLAIELDTNVAIHDSDPEDMIVFHPNNTYQVATGYSENDCYIVELYGNEKNVEDLLKTLLSNKFIG